MSNRKELLELAISKGYFAKHVTFLDQIDLINPEHWYIELCLIQRWLRDEKNIHVLVDHDIAGWFWLIKNVNGELIDDWDYVGLNIKGNIHDYTLEEGLRRTLTLCK